MHDEDRGPRGRPAPAYVPVLGRIAAGWADSRRAGGRRRVPAAREIVGEGRTLFLLAVKGDSMLDAAICDGDWVVVRQQPERRQQR